MTLNEQIQIIKDQLKILHQDKQALKQQRLETSKRAARSYIRSELKIINQEIKEYSSYLKLLERNFRQDCKHASASKRDCDTRYQFAKSLPRFIRNNLDTHDPFFVSLRFINPKEKTSKEQYPKFIKLLRENLEYAISNETSQSQSKLFFIAILEEQPMYHYHAFMMIPKDKGTDFMSRCVIKTVPEYIKKIEKTKDTYILKRQILDAYCANKQKHYLTHITPEPVNKIMIDDYQICKLNEDNERYAISNYIMKSFINSPSLEYDDIVIDCRD